MSRASAWVNKAKERLDNHRELEDKAFRRFLEKYQGAEKGTRTKNRNQRGCLASNSVTTDLSRKSIVIIGENGIGDEVLTISCLPQFLEHASCSSVIWRGDPKAKTIFTRSFPNVAFVSNVDPCPNSEGTIYSWELIGRFRNKLDDFSWTQNGGFKPYLRHSGTLKERLRARYANDSRIVVGLAWRSERDGDLLSDKTCDLRDVPHWAEFFEHLKDKVRFISLQYGDTQHEIAFARWKYGVEIYHDDSIDILNDVDAAASQIAAIDYIVSISTTAAHLAGALGIPGWVMLPTNPFAHWRAGNDICLWYPTLRTIRRDSAGDWQSVLEVIKRELTEDIEHEEQ